MCLWYHEIAEFLNKYVYGYVHVAPLFELTPTDAHQN